MGVNVEAASLFCIVVIEDHVFTSRREYQGVRLRSKRIEMIAQRASICHLQIVLDNVLETRWYGGWDRLSDAIDSSVTVQAEDIFNERKAQKIMLDDSFSQSRMCFQLLYLLRIALEWMKETQEGLQDFYRIFGIHPLRGWHESTSETAKFDRIVEENWDRVMEQFDSLQAKLERRIEVKADEMCGLQDGVCLCVFTESFCEQSY